MLRVSQNSTGRETCQQTVNREENRELRVGFPEARLGLVFPREGHGPAAKILRV